jgi:hypothetical protein
VIDLPENLRDLTERLVLQHRALPDNRGQSFAVPADLDDRIIRHEGFNLLCQQGFSAGKDGLAGLALLLEQLPDQSIGHWSREPAPEVILLMAGCQSRHGVD